MCDTQGAGETAPVVDQKLSIPLLLKVTFRESLAHQSFFYHFLRVSTVNKNLSVIG